MNTTATIIVLCAVSSVVASVLTVSAAMLSSRISQAENLTEEYENVESSPQVAPHTYSLKG